MEYTVDNLSRKWHPIGLWPSPSQLDSSSHSSRRKLFSFTLSAHPSLFCSKYASQRLILVPAIFCASVYFLSGESGTGKSNASQHLFIPSLYPSKAALLHEAEELRLKASVQYGVFFSLIVVRVSSFPSTLSRGMVPFSILRSLVRLGSASSSTMRIGAYHTAFFAQIGSVEVNGLIAC